MVWCRERVVAAFGQSDGLMRDVAIATLVRVGHGLTTDGIGALCGVSHGWVCEVRKRYRDGGLEAVLARGTLGPPRLLVGKKAERLKKMHGAGVARRAIAEALGVSEALIAKEVKRLGLPRSGWANGQQTIAGVGAGTRSRGDRRANASRSAAAARVTSVEREAPRSQGDGEVVPPEKPALPEVHGQPVANSAGDANALGILSEGDRVEPDNAEPPVAKSADAIKLSSVPPESDRAQPDNDEQNEPAPAAPSRAAEAAQEPGRPLGHPARCCCAQRPSRSACRVPLRGRAWSAPSSPSTMRFKSCLP